MRSNPFKAIDDAVRSVIEPMAVHSGRVNRQPLIWESVRDNPKRMANYVRQRTGLSGQPLVDEVVKYSNEMRRRYG